MVDSEVVLERLRHLRSALTRIEEKKLVSQGDLFGNPDTQDVVLRNMQNALQSCLDIASHIVADEGWGQPQRASDFFLVLADHKVIPSALAHIFVKLIKFRNILVHEYTRLDLQKTWDAVSEGTRHIDSFAQAIAQWLEPVV